ncbi:MAG: hypothetical protein J1E79_01220 [Rikenella sp.]|nr:hypothetical protein [Rikenella sp.]
MEDTTTFFIVLGCIAVVVLQIIMIVKFFQMAADIRNLRNVAFNKYQEHHAPKWKPENSPFSEIKTPPFAWGDGGVIIFDDGKCGHIIQEFGTFSFLDNDNNQIFCHSKKEAIRGLYHTLSQQTESEK